MKSSSKADSINNFIWQSWNWNILFQGHRGSRGVSGERGLPGPRGRTGKNGDNGAAGKPGVSLWKVEGNGDGTAGGMVLIPPAISGGLDQVITLTF
jgi:hypothetical protein